MEDLPRAIAPETMSMTGWVLAGVAAVVTALSSAVSYLFFLRNSEIQRSIEELKRQLDAMTSKADECHEERAQIKAQCEANTVRIEFLTKEIQKLQRGAN